MEAKGRTLLKVMGILMIIGGALSIIVTGIVGLIGAAGASAVAQIENADIAAVGGAVAGTLILIAIIGLVSGIVELIAGIVGVKNSGKPEKSVSCIVWGIIVLILSIISLILSLSNSSQGAFNIIISIVFGLAIPVLYLIGAFMNKKSYNNARGVETSFATVASDLKEGVKSMDEDVAAIAKDAKEKVEEVKDSIENN